MVKNCNTILAITCRYLRDSPPHSTHFTLVGFVQAEVKQLFSTNKFLESNLSEAGSVLLAFAKYRKSSQGSCIGSLGTNPPFTLVPILFSLSKHFYTYILNQTTRAFRFYFYFMYVYKYIQCSLDISDPFVLRGVA